MTATLKQLATACQVPTNIARTVVITPDENMPTGCLNIYVGDAMKRYPDDSVYPPTEADPRWTWGPNFEFWAPADLSAVDLAERIAASITERL